MQAVGKKPSSPLLKIIILLVIAAAVLVFAISRIGACAKEAWETAQFAHAHGSFIAVGDNLPD